MKNIIISIALAGIAFTACNNSGNKSTEESQAVTRDSTTATAAGTQVYACPMHPEVTGKKGDKCSKCGMALTAVQSNNDQLPATTPVGTEVNAKVSIKEIVTDFD